MVEQKKQNTTSSVYGNVPGYDPSQPANSAQNRTALANYTAKNPGVNPAAATPPPRTSPPPPTPSTPSKGSGQTISKAAITPTTTPDARTQADIAYNKNVESEREIAPGYIASDSPQNVAVRKAEIAAMEQLYSEGGFVQEKGSTDQFTKQRESALKTGSFDYAKYPGSEANKYFTPQNFLTPTGERSSTNVQVTAGTPNPQQKAASQQRTLDDQLQNIQTKLSRGVGLTSQEELIYHTALQQKRDISLFGSEAVTGVQPQSSTPAPTRSAVPPPTPSTPTAPSKAPVQISVSSTVLAKSDALRKAEGEKPLEQTLPLQVITYKTDTRTPVKVSETTLAKSDALRKAEGEQPLEKTIPLEVFTYKTAPAVKVSETTLAKSDALRKAEGEKPLEKTASLEVYSYKPAPKTVSVSSTVLAQSDKLRKQQGEQPLEKITPLQVVTYKEDVRAELAQAQGLLQQGQSSEVSRFLAFPSVPDIVAKPLKIEQKEKVQSDFLPSTTIVEAVSFIPFGGAGLGIATKLGKVAETVATKLEGSPVTKIIKGVESVEEFKPISQTTVAEVKPVGKLTTFEQVGVPKTEININPEIAKLEPQIIREGGTFEKTTTTTVKTATGEIQVPTFEKTGGLVKAEVPQAPKSTLQEPVTGISRTGKPEPVPQQPKATLTQPEAIGEPKIPVTLVSKEATAYFTGPSSKVIATDVLATEITEKQAGSLGFVKEEGLVRSYRGQLTEDVLKKMEKMGLADVALQFTERTSEAAKVSEPLAFEIANPEFLGKFSGLRPAVTRIVTGGGRYELKRSEQEAEKLPEDLFKEDTAKGTGKIEPRAQFYKPTLEEVKERYPLMSVKEEMIPDIISKMSAGTTTEAVKETPFTSSPLGLISQQEERPILGKVTRAESEIISMKTPPGFATPSLALKEKTGLESVTSLTESQLNISKSELGTQELTKQVSSLISTTKEIQKPDLTTDTTITTKTETDLIIVPIQTQPQIQKLITPQITKQVQELTTPPTFEEPPPTRTQPPDLGPPLPNIPDKYNKLFEKRKKAKGKDTQQFTGNAPLTSVVGLTKGQEVVYGKAAEKRAAESFRSTKKNELVLGSNRKSTFLRPQGNKFSSEKKRKIKF